ncbi:MAG TPA: hypothetical protein VKU00_13640 [Chthonomonadaceae bacterium]|nr:hypothetical protein [Chthonomonadaceae bacterium]
MMERESGQILVVAANAAFPAKTSHYLKFARKSSFFLSDIALMALVLTGDGAEMRLPS